jgi:phosphatidylethanolamine/phosphatidyl-N-methylethanolamine N-methyltransferase
MNHFEIDVQAYYANYYDKINVSARKSSLIFFLMHSFIEVFHRTNIDKAILEIGINQAEHFKFVKKPFLKYTGLDVRDIFEDKKTKEYFLANEIDFVLGSVEALPFEDSTFDRVILTCVLHHLSNPVEALSEIRRIVRPNGSITILLPNDPGLTYRIFRALTTLRVARRLGMYREVELLHALEHKNHFLSLRTLLKEFYSRDQIQEVGFPMYFNSYNLNAISPFEIKVLK